MNAATIPNIDEVRSKSAEGLAARKEADLARVVKDIKGAAERGRLDVFYNHTWTCGVAPTQRLFPETVEALRAAGYTVVQNCGSALFIHWDDTIISWAPGPAAPEHFRRGDL